MTDTQSVSVAVRAVDELIPYERNARKHPPEKVRKLADLIREFGWTNPILADEVGIVAGHRRRLAAQLIYAEGGTIRLPGGQELPPGTVPVVDCTGWSETQRRAYILADNQTTLEGEWDYDLLRLELTFLEGAGVDLGLTGFDGAALEAALGVPKAESEPDPLKVSLADRFGVVPFSVLNAREGWWQDRKAAWLALGIQSEVGRGENLLRFSDTINEPDQKKRAAAKESASLKGGLTFGTTADPYRAKAEAKPVVAGNGWGNGGPARRDAAFYAKKRAWEAANGRKISTAEFREKHWDGAANGQG